MLFLCGLSSGLPNLQLSYLYILHMNWNKKSGKLGPITLIRSERAGPGPALHRQPFGSSNHKQLHRWKRIPEITLSLTRLALNCECEILRCFYFKTYCIVLQTIPLSSRQKSFIQTQCNNSCIYTSTNLVHTTRFNRILYTFISLKQNSDCLQNVFQ